MQTGDEVHPRSDPSTVSFLSAGLSARRGQRIRLARPAIDAWLAMPWRASVRLDAALVNNAGFVTQGQELNIMPELPTRRIKLVCTW